MVFSMAQELGYTLPQEPWAALCRYLQHKWDAENRQHCSPALHYAVGRALGNTASVVWEVSHKVPLLTIFSAPVLNVQNNVAWK